MKVKLEIPLTLKEIGAAIGALYEGEDREIRGISTDSRETGAEDLFFALTGERDSGEAYVEKVLLRGGAAVCAHRHSGALLVADTEAALLRLAAHYRKKLTALRSVIAVTGSVGKTTTKEFLASLLAQKYRIHATRGNYNNALGVSLTLLSAPKDTEVLICEAGMNHLGELSPISEALSPDLAIITLIGTAHIGNLGSREMIAKAKREILVGMRGGTVLIPHGESYLSDIEGAKTVSTVCAEADFFLMPIETRLTGSVADLYAGEKRISSVTLPTAGAHLLTPLAFAMAAALTLGLSETEIRRGVSTITSDKTRQNIYKIGRLTILDDAYNASYESVRAAIEMLDLFPPKKKALLLGDMRELGSMTEELHREIGTLAAWHGISALFLFGVYAPYTARGALLCGFDPAAIFQNTDLSAPERTASDILRTATEETVLLVKGSRGVQMERILDAMKRMTEEEKNA